MNASRSRRRFAPSHPRCYLPPTPLAGGEFLLFPPFSVLIVPSVHISCARFSANVVIIVRTENSESVAHSDRPPKPVAISDVAGDEFDILSEGLTPVLSMTSSTGEAQNC